MIEVDPDRNYTKSERIQLGLAQWHLEKEAGLTPNVGQIALTMNVVPNTLRNHVRNPRIGTRGEHHQKMQTLPKALEDALADRAVYMDDWNIAPTKDDFYDLVVFMTSRADLSMERPGVNWLLRFVQRNPKVKYVFTSQLDRNRANAERWDIMDDYFAKVRSSARAGVLTAVG